MIKGCYAPLNKISKRLLLNNKKQVHKYGLLILIAIQYVVYFNYKILREKINILKASYYIKIKEMEVI